MRYLIFFFFLIIIATSVNGANCGYGSCSVPNALLEEGKCVYINKDPYIVDIKCNVEKCKVYVNKKSVECCSKDDCDMQSCLENNCVKECKNGDKICGLNNLYICEEYDYKLIKECELGCENDACIISENKILNSLWIKIVLGGLLVPVVLLLILILGVLINKLLPKDIKKYKNRCVKCDAKVKRDAIICPKCGKVLKQK